MIQLLKLKYIIILNNDVGIEIFDILVNNINYILIFI